MPRPRLRAAETPALSCRTQVMRFPYRWARYSPVPSLDPSSTTMISSTGRVCASTESIARATRPRRFQVGMMTEVSGMSAMAADLVKRALYRSGLLGLYHRLRNRRALTVIMFHRVLTQQDPRWASCDPDYTLEAGLLERCLEFFRRHYNVVSSDDVLAARRDGTPLPDRALLITFDDGWADNHAHA